MSRARRLRSPLVTRRRLLLGAAALGGGRLLGPPRPAFARGDRPTVTHGVQAGDVDASGAVLWARSDRPARMRVELAATESFRNPRTIAGPAALAVGDFTAKLAIDGLPAGEDVFYRIAFESLDYPGAVSAPVVGRLRTAPAARRDIRFLWTGDTAGQGWGINPEWGGMRGYATMADQNADFLIHSGDVVYADGPIPSEQRTADGRVWKNLVTEATAKVAETLDEFRGNYRYNLLDEHVRRFNATTAILAQWDDHEVVDNWYPGEMLEDDDRYTVKSVDLLAARASRAFHEYLPLRTNPLEAGRVYRRIAYGPSLDVFFLDLRSYRGPNGRNDQDAASAATAFLGRDQIRWLKQALLASRATWKVIASDMPLGLIVYDDWRTRSSFENGANGDGPPRGRELEIADLLRFIKLNDVRNTVWLTADVHYTAAHRYDPNRAAFQDFAPFWEFVSGPIHAGSFGPNRLDDTFGPEVVFASHPGAGQVNLPPWDGMQFFGHVAIDGTTEAMTVTLKDIADRSLWSTTLEPEPS